MRPMVVKPFLAVSLAVAAAQKIDCRPFYWQGVWENDGFYEINNMEWDANQVRQEKPFKEQCEDRGCTYDAAKEVMNPNREPPCTFQFVTDYRWHVVSEDSGEGVDMEYYTLINAAQPFFPDYPAEYEYPPPIENLKFIVHHEAPYRLRLKLEDADKARYQVPPPYGKMQSPTGDLNVDPLYTFMVRTTPFSFRIERAAGDMIWDTDLPGQIYEDQFIQISTQLSSTFLYGFGENMRDSWKHPFDIYRRVQMFTRDAIGSQLEGPTYGHHPFYMGLDGRSGLRRAHGVFWLNSNAQEVDLIPADDNDVPAMTFRAVGGIFDFYFFFGPEPEDVIQQFTNAIGRPYLVPFWSLGFQTCQWHYGSLGVVDEMYRRMTEAEIPWDVIQHDIDYMERQMDFTVDPINYPGMKQWDLARKAEGFRIVVMLDPALNFADNENYAPQSYDCCHYEIECDCCTSNDCIKSYPATDTGFDLDIFVKLMQYDRDAVYEPNENWGDRGNFINLPAAGYRIVTKEELFENLVHLEGKVWPDWGNITIFNQNIDESQFPPDCVGCSSYDNTYDLCHSPDNFGWNHQVKYCFGPAGFPDFFKETAQQWWKDHLRNFIRTTVPVDAIWIDMNEPVNFIHGSYNYLDDDFWVPEADGHFFREGGSCPNSRYDFPPYHLREWGTFNHGTFAKTMCMGAIMIVNGNPELHYDVHSIYGAMNAIPTWEAVREETNTRSFVFSRSTYSGVGSYIGHWTGDNASRWEHLKYQAVGNLDFNLFGIPYVGADVCGFFDDTTEHLCMRWTQNGAFQTFWRNHNSKHARWQDPANFSSIFSAAAKKVHEKRYELIPYIYTLFFKVHVLGGTVSRSMMHEFLNIDNSGEVEVVDTQFMFGSALLVSPPWEWYEENGERFAEPHTNFYLPSGARWFERETGQEFAAGKYHKVRTPLYNYKVGIADPLLPREDDCLLESPPCYVIEDCVLHMRGGSIIAEQQAGNNTRTTRNTGFTIRVALDDNYAAKGDLFWDDGESQDTIERGDYALIEFEAFIGSGKIHGEDVEGFFVTWNYTKRHESAIDLWVDKVLVYGLEPEFERAGLFVYSRTYEHIVSNYTIEDTGDEERLGVDLLNSRRLAMSFDPPMTISLQSEMAILYTDTRLITTAGGYRWSLSVLAFTTCISFIF